jgi:hypothetical protein
MNTGSERRTSCLRCNGKFVCQAGNIHACDCTKVTLSNKEQTYIQEKYNNCLCNTCLIELKKEFNLIHAHKTEL